MLMKVPGDLILVLLDVYRTYSLHKHRNLFVTIRYPNLHHERPLFAKKRERENLFTEYEQTEIYFNNIGIGEYVIQDVQLIT